MRRHLAFLAVFFVGIVCVWMLPVMLAGFPDALPGYIPEARAFAKTGMLSGLSGKIPTLVTHLTLPYIGSNALSSWSFFGSIIFAVGVMAWWATIRKLFDETVAWISSIIVSLMPMYWIEIVHFTGYTFALTFLFLSFASYVYLEKQNRIGALCLSGLFFGWALASIDAFVTFIPWFVVAYFWIGRLQWKRTLVHIAVFLAVAYGAFVSPLITNAIYMEGSIADRLAVFLPTTQNRIAPTGHLYPDDYTFEHDKEAYDKIIEERIADASFIEQQQDASYRAMHGVGDTSAFSMIVNRLWLFGNSLPTYFLTETVGGVFLWIFILPGILYLHRSNKRLLILMTGLWLCMEFVVRFVIGFARDHSADVGFLLAVLAALGVVELSIAFRNHTKRYSVATIAAVCVLCISLQLLQANRKHFARLYARSNVLEAFAARDALAALPRDAVIGYPRSPHLLYFSDLQKEMIHNDTIDRLEGRTLREPFKIYGVTHIIGYSDERSHKIRSALPRIQAVDLPRQQHPVPLNHFTRYLLHLIR